MKCITIGHASYDITYSVQEYPKENTKKRVYEQVECGGGPAANAACVLAKWKEEVAFSGVVGDDYYASKMKKEFQDFGIDLSYLEEQKNLKTMLSFIIANKGNGSRTILTYHDPNKKSLTVKNNNQYDIILVDGEELEASKEVLLNNSRAIKILDAGSVKEGTLGLAGLVDYLVCSKNFAEETTGITYTGKKEELIEMHDRLQEKYQNQVVITLESNGCFTKIEEKYYLIPSIKVKAIDSTGAGDIFHGAFAYFISHQYGLKRSCYLANIAGALSVTTLGGRISIPKLEDVLEREQEIELL